ncbi:MAG: hypothetical protein AB1714_31245 [Acidobacteriota bacterium]
METAIVKATRVLPGFLPAALLVCILPVGLAAGQATQSVDQGLSLAKAIPVQMTTFLGYGTPCDHSRGEQEATMVPVFSVDTSVAEMRIKTDSVEARGALGFVVPAGQRLEVRLEHPQASYFEIVMVNRYGLSQGGLYQNLIDKGSPVGIFTNTTQTAQGIYVIVRYPEFMYQTPTEFVLKTARTN